jgi:hypothetical protein
VTAAALLAGSAARAQEQRKPNILAIFGDDIGQTDQRLLVYRITGRDGRSAGGAAIDRGLIDVDPIESSDGGGGGWESG